MPVTGDLTQNQSYDTKATAFPYTKVELAQLSDQDAMINQTYLSGKKDGAGIIGSDYNLYVATGSAPADPWVLVGGDGTNDITPA